MTFIQAVCCEVSYRPGVAHATTLTGHLPERLTCAECGKEYAVDYSPHDTLRIPDFESKVRASAQRAINRSHPTHGNYVDLGEV